MWREQARLSLPGRQEKPNEDGAVVRIEGERALFAVLDGVSSIDGSVDGYKVDGTFVPGGCWAMRQVQQHLEMVPLADIADAFNAVCGADEALERAFDGRGVNHEVRWRLPAVAGIVVVTDVAEQTFTWAQVADGMLMHERPDGVRFALENHMREVDAATLEVFRACDGRRDDERVKAKLREQYERRNTAGSYPVLDGAVNRDLVRSGCVPLAEVKRFALWSDGLQTVADAPHDVGTAILTGGLDAWYRAVVAREEADSTFMNPLRYNNDDKSGLIIERA